MFNLLVHWATSNLKLNPQTLISHLTSALVWYLQSVNSVSDHHLHWLLLSLCSVVWWAVRHISFCFWTHFISCFLTWHCVETDISKGLCIIWPIYGWLLPGEGGNHFPCSGFWRVIDELLTLQCMLLLVQCPLVPWVHVKKLTDVWSTARHGLSGKDYT